MIIYLAAGNAKLKYKNVLYNDLLVKRDINTDLLFTDIKKYDLVIATPPCNYYSRLNSNIFSNYSQSTKHLLPFIIFKCIAMKKNFIIENVINDKRMYFLNDLYGLCYIKKHGRHIYFMSHNIDITVVPQTQDFVMSGIYIGNSDRQGGDNVNNVIDYYIKSLIDMGVIKNDEN